MANIYFFDPLAALEVAKQQLQVDTHLQSCHKQVCFYNGESYSDMPENCISVPINDFYNYFFTTSHTLPQQINFDNQNFDEATKKDITQSIVETLTQVQKERVQIIVKIIQAPLDTATASAYIKILLDYLQYSDVSPENIETEILDKLLDLTQFILTNNVILDHDTLETIESLLQIMSQKYSLQISKNIKVMHFNYALRVLISKEQNLDDYFKQLLTLLDDIALIITDYKLVTHVFTEALLSGYLSRMQGALFNDDFLSLTILAQKQIIYKYYYLTNLCYGRGEAYRDMYYALLPYFQQALTNGLEELAFFLYTPLQMSWNGTAQTQDEFKHFNNELERPLELFIKNKMIKKYALKPVQKAVELDKKVIKVAFLQERIIDYSINKVFMSLLKALKEHPQTTYEFTIYDLNFMEFGGSDETAVNALKDLGFNYVNLHETLVGNQSPFYSIVEKSLKVREVIISEHIDILIGMHSRPEYNFLFTTRTAPRQVYWSHGNYMYDIDAIDIKILHSDEANTQSVISREGHQFHPFLMRYDLQTLAPDVNSQELQALKQKYSQYSAVLGSIGRLSKLNNDLYLNAVAKIMHQNKNTVYLACGSGDQHDIQNKVTKLGISDRFIFTGHVDSHLYGSVIDLYLNTFPNSSGESLNEYMAKGGLSVILLEENHPVIQNLFKNNKQNEYRRIHAYSIEDYIQLANKILNDSQLQEDLAIYMSEIIQSWNNINTNVSASFYNALTADIQGPL